MMKMARLYEQGASSRRIGQYIIRWERWVLCMIVPVAGQSRACREDGAAASQMKMIDAKLANG